MVEPSRVELHIGRRYAHIDILLRVSGGVKPLFLLTPPKIDGIEALENPGEHALAFAP
jgi:hypothetical protein